MSGRSRKGRCPTVFAPMAADDGLLARVKPSAATLPALAARALAEAARACGNGRIDLTMRGNLQVRGLRPETVERFAAVALEHGLAHPDQRVEAVRNVAADPLGPDDPRAGFDSHALARAVEAEIAADARLRDLPPKFGFLVDAGHALPIGDARADIHVRARDGRTVVRLDAGRLMFACDADAAPGAGVRLARAFLDLARDATVAARMRGLLERLGEAAVWTAAGLAPEPGIVAPASPPPAEIYAPPPPGAPIGYLPLGPGGGALVARAPVGRIDAATLVAAADLAERFADGGLRLTPWRALVFAGVAAGRAEALASALDAVGLAARAPGDAASIGSAA